MHHRGPRELVVGATYYLREDPTNRYDKNAIAVVDERDRVSVYQSLQNRFSTCGTPSISPIVSQMSLHNKSA